MKWHVPVWEGFLFGGSNAEKWGDYRRKNFFINNSDEALILLKEGHYGLLKMHIHLGGLPVWGKNGTPKRHFL